MLLAVPSTIFAAPSMSAALRSGIFVLAISSTWALLTVPTFILFGSPLPLSSPAACFRKNAAGRCLGYKGERTVLVDRDLHGDDLAHLVARGVVELPHELADVHLRLAQGRAYRRSRVGLPASDLQLQFARYAAPASSTHMNLLLRASLPG